MTIHPKTLTDLLDELATGARSVDDVQKSILQQLESTPTQADETVRLDLERLDRCGYPEVIYAPGKSLEALTEGFQALLSANQNCLATRCSESQGDSLQKLFPGAIYDPVARTVRIQLRDHQAGRVAIVTAGTSDRPVALEALETLRWMNVEAELLMDVGVAGPQRFLGVKHKLTDCDAVVVVAGMEGALPSVVAGWLSCPIIAVPTSVGYGAAFGGVAALLGMLNSCASNVAVVNIDAGFKAAYLAGMIAQRPAKEQS